MSNEAASLVFPGLAIGLIVLALCRGQMICALLEWTGLATGFGASTLAFDILLASNRSSAKMLARDDCGIGAMTVNSWSPTPIGSRQIAPAVATAS
jgi:hypothetical protein